MKTPGVTGNRRGEQPNRTDHARREQQYIAFEKKKAGLIPGAGQAHLGHNYGDTTRRFYIDPRLIGSRRPLPRLTDNPALEGCAA